MHHIHQKTNFDYNLTQKYTIFSCNFIKTSKIPLFILTFLNSYVNIITMYSFLEVFLIAIKFRVLPSIFLYFKHNEIFLILIYQLP